MDKTLINFYNDTYTRNAVHEYLINFLKEEALRKVFDKEDVSAVAEAKEMLDKAFSGMDTMFSIPETIKEQVNEAR